jgi:AmmeMemoRadiSam system protein B
MRYYLLIFSLLIIAACNRYNQTGKNQVRNFVDTIGFAHLNWQMDSVIARIERSKLDSLGSHCKGTSPLKIAICPHDDYSLAGPLYYSVIKDVHAKTIIMFGVAHKARALGVENKIVFGSYTSWKSPAGTIRINMDFQNAILARLDTALYFINDSLQKVEHSLEAITPFMQHFSPEVRIIPILIPAMSRERMNRIADSLSRVIRDIAFRNNLKWGTDFAFVISTDAVHYGDEDWGGKNYAPFGADTLGYWMAIDHEKEIIRNCLQGELNVEKCSQFYSYTLQPDNFREYKWTWCGRYSVPFGLLTACFLGKLQDIKLDGCIYGYATSIDHPRIRVDDLRMGLTSPAKLRHWVGYSAVGYR